MPRHSFSPPEGRIESFEIEAVSLKGNLLGDPSRRQVWVYLPPEHETDDQAEFPLLVALAPFTSSGARFVNWHSYSESLPQRIDRLRGEGRLGPCIVAMPDAFTSLGGNQYVNTPVLGNWSDFLLQEMLPELERRYRVLPGPRHRAAFGKSSGGYGALVQGLRNGSQWGAVACQSGDVGFDIASRRDLPAILLTLAAYDYDPVRFLAAFEEAPTVQGDALYAAMFLALAGSYDPAPDQPLGIRLPVDPHTGELIEERWNRWLEHDPLSMIEEPTCRDSLRDLRGLMIDCGNRDQYFLQFGARRLHRRLDQLGIDHVYEEFDGTHSGIDHRMDRSLPFLYERIRPD